MIKGYIGRGGAGKTFSAVRHCWQLFRKGKDIYSTTPLVDLRVYFDESRGMWLPVDAELFGLDWAAGYVTQMRDIYDLDNATVLLDEVGGWLPADAWRDVPPEFKRFLAQDRREGVDLVWSHRTMKVFHELRDNTAEIVRSMRFGPLLVQTIFDPDEPDKRHFKFAMITPRIWDLYQTLARVGDAEGKGYGMGRRSAYRSRSGGKSLIRLEDWGPHRVSLMVRPEQYSCLIRKFGPEACGVHRQENDNGFVRYIAGPCSWQGHATYDSLRLRRFS